jgi:hypothetical protein
MLTTDTRRMMGLYVHYTNGFLPSGGGILDQTGYYYQAMEILSVEVNRIARDMQEKERDKFKQQRAARGVKPTRTRPRKRAPRRHK